MEERLLIPVSSTSLKIHGIPFAPATWRKWYHLKKFPGLIIKISGRLFIDSIKWQEMVNIASEKSSENANLQ